jgi:hypothetical protein
MATLPLPPGSQGSATAESRAVIARFDPLQTWLFDERRIEVPVVTFGAPPQRWFRVSAHAHNTLGDYARLAEALTEAQKNHKLVALRRD